MRLYHALAALALVVCGLRGVDAVRGGYYKNHQFQLHPHCKSHHSFIYAVTMDPEMCINDYNLFWDVSLLGISKNIIIIFGSWVQ